ncbi:MAG: hypothetical protein KAV83_11765 [Desulfobacterales bacterium]|nr:hypothetical protein [Desulfobacterales bacterium]
MKTKTASTIATALVEMLNRLTPDEKKQFARIFNWDEFGRIKKEINGSDGRKHGDPKVYVEAGPGELNFEMPESKLIDFIRFLSEVLSYDIISVFIRKGETSGQHSYSKEEFRDFLVSSERVFVENYLMIEFGRNTLISGGGGCIDLELEKENIDLVKEIAETFLEMCGFKHRFSKHEFYAIVWDDEIEVNECSYRFVKA